MACLVAARWRADRQGAPYDDLGETKGRAAGIPPPLPRNLVIPLAIFALYIFVCMPPLLGSS
jgi:hypothetical protein